MRLICQFYFQGGDLARVSHPYDLNWEGRVKWHMILNGVWGRGRWNHRLSPGVIPP